MVVTGCLVTAERNRRGDGDDARMGALAAGPVGIAAVAVAGRAGLSGAALVLRCARSRYDEES